MKRSKKRVEQGNCFADDLEWHNSLTEACISQMPKQLRQLFVFICVFCGPSEPLNIWNTFQQHFIVDYLQEFDIDENTSRALIDVQKMVLSLSYFEC